MTARLMIKNNKYKGGLGRVVYTQTLPLDWEVERLFSIDRWLKKRARVKKPRKKY